MGDGHDTPDVDLLPAEATDVGKITDVTALKAMFYDQQLVMETARNNLGIIQQRIEQLSTVIPESNGKG